MIVIACKSYGEGCGPMRFFESVNPDVIDNLLQEKEYEIKHRDFSIPYQRGMWHHTINGGHVHGNCLSIACCFSTVIVGFHATACSCPSVIFSKVVAAQMDFFEQGFCSTRAWSIEAGLGKLCSSNFWRCMWVCGFLGGRRMVAHQSRHLPSRD